MSKNAVSGFMPAMRPFGPSATASTSAGTGREVNTTSEASATWRGELAQTAPLARNGSAAARLRSWTVSWWPAFCRLAAMPLPIMPSPMKPTRISILPTLSDQLRPLPASGGGTGEGGVQPGQAQASPALAGVLFDELVAGRADRRRAGRAAIAVEGRIAVEFQRIGDELGAHRPTRCGAARIGDGLIGD